MPKSFSAISILTTLIHKVHQCGLRIQRDGNETSASWIVKDPGLTRRVKSCNFNSVRHLKFMHAALTFIMTCALLLFFSKIQKNIISLHHNMFAPYGTSIFKTSSIDVYYLSQKHQLTHNSFYWMDFCDAEIYTKKHHRFQKKNSGEKKGHES